MRVVLLCLSASVFGSSNPLSPGGPYNTASQPIKGVLNVHLVPHTHDDVGWLKTVDQLYLGARNDIQISGVQFIIDSVIDALAQNPARKFIYVEMAFFSRWWRRQNDLKRAQVLGLLQSGQLEFINGGWDSNDEATPTFLDIIDQHTMGSTFIAREFGSQFNPSVGWQVDPFGHSLFQAKAYDKMGMNAWFFGRSDAQDFAVRGAKRTLETIHSSILAGSMDGYGPPSGFDWNIISADEPLNDDEYLGSPNIDSKIETLVQECMRRASVYNDPLETTQHVMLTMGSDFQYEYAHTWFSNMDKLIHYANLDGRVNVFYSTPTIYVESRKSQRETWIERGDYDWFPYCDSEHTKAESSGTIVETDGRAFWTGYFSSRPILKRLVRKASAVLELCRLVEIVTVLPHTVVEDKDRPSWVLWEALSVVQHHDGVSGTAQQHVTDDYTRRLEEGIAGCLTYFSKDVASDRPSAQAVTSAVYRSMLFSSSGIDSSVEQTGTVSEAPTLTAYLAYYNSSLGNTEVRPDQPSGAYIFRPDCPEGAVAACKPTRIDADWASVSIDGNQISWTVGPIPQDNGLVGKEVVLIIEPQTVIHNNGTFFTDSNGYEWVRREINKRPTWDLVVTDPVAGNYYPATAGIAILDDQNGLVVTTDRSVGGTSLRSNQVEIMVHRRTFKDDHRGVDEPLNERDEDGNGIVVSGVTEFKFVKTHGDAGTVPVRVPMGYLRTPIGLGQLELGPALKLLEQTTGLVHLAASTNLAVTHAHRVSVPEFCLLGDHDCVLIRIMHRDPERGIPEEVDLSSLLRDRPTVKVTETVLNGGMTVENAKTRKIHWTPQARRHIASPVTDDMKVVIAPGEIRTFILETITPLSRSASSEESIHIETV